MAKKMNPNSLANLKPFKTSEEAKKNGSVGGKQRAQNERENKTFSNYCKIIANQKVKNPKTKDKLREFGIKNKDQKNLASLALVAFYLAADGNLQALKAFLEAIGEGNGNEEKTTSNIRINIMPAVEADDEGGEN